MSESMFEEFQKKIREIENEGYRPRTSSSSHFKRNRSSYRGSLAPSANGASESGAATRSNVSNRIAESDHGRKTAFERIVSLSKTRDRCSKELEDRLRREGYSDQEVAAAIERSVSCGLVDDRRFADVYVRSKSRALWGPRTIERELSKRNLSADMLDGWPDEYGLDDQSLYEKANELLDRRPPTSKNVQASAYRRLLTKGYPQPIAYDVAQRWAQENGQ